MIFVVVAMNSIIGAYQEGRAEHALAALLARFSEPARAAAP